MLVEWTRKHMLWTAGIAVIVSLGGIGAYLEFDTSWIGPRFGLNVEDESCLSVASIMERARIRTSDHSAQALETVPTFWEQIIVHKMPERTAAPHGQAGQVSVGDVVCVGHVSQAWIYLPTGDEAAGHCVLQQWPACLDQ